MTTIWLVFDQDDPHCGEGRFVGAFTSKVKAKQCIDSSLEENYEVRDKGDVIEVWSKARRTKSGDHFKAWRQDRHAFSVKLDEVK